MDKELAHQLQVEEELAEEAHQGRDAATLEVVMEVASPLMRGYREGLGACTGQAHPKAAGPSHSPMAAEVQLPMVVA